MPNFPAESCGYHSQILIQYKMAMSITDDMQNQVVINIEMGKTRVAINDVFDGVYPHMTKPGVYILRFNKEFPALPAKIMEVIQVMEK